MHHLCISFSRSIRKVPFAIFLNYNGNSFSTNAHVIIYILFVLHQFHTALPFMLAPLPFRFLCGQNPVGQLLSSAPLFNNWSFSLIFLALFFHVLGSLDSFWASQIGSQVLHLCQEVNLLTRSDETLRWDRGKFTNCILKIGLCFCVCSRLVRYWVGVGLAFLGRWPLLLLARRRAAAAELESGHWIVV